ncbi:hypothetical protein SAMN05216480_12331 [Pustulibacterium marinum]|uniref:Uncharacterized protein n=1 Tax=Pustulibacterium marinum TaxID=1224947 RepID=A0A1I7IWC8_9FLAO|nr:hypothetical protein [Pustulibacterium marinum]SFU77233.1 hypothetical protein SAMN05216480_12331 [Pustulibacterium marinum]
MSKETRVLTVNECRLLLMLSQIEHIEPLYNELIQKDGGWVLKAIAKHFEASEIETDKKIMIFILDLGDGIIGKCVNYIYDLIKWAKNRGSGIITWKNLTEDIYAHGIPVFN